MATYNLDSQSFNPDPEYTIDFGGFGPGVWQEPEAESLTPEIDDELAAIRSQQEVLWQQQREQFWERLLPTPDGFVARAERPENSAPWWPIQLPTGTVISARESEVLIAVARRLRLRIK